MQITDYRNILNIEIPSGLLHLQKGFMKIFLLDSITVKLGSGEASAVVPCQIKDLC